MTEDNTKHKVFGVNKLNEDLVCENQDRKSRIHKRIDFGIDFLDDAFGGIYPNDLVVFGAKTGVGKTQAAMLIALHNAINGKRVLYFALEAAKYEISRRMKYQVIFPKYLELPFRSNYFNYKDWSNGGFYEELKDKDKEADDELNNNLKNNLVTYYRTEDFTITEFDRIYKGLKDEVDLVIVDHLHYFDSVEQNENKAVKEILKGMKWNTDNLGKPIILVSHVRKIDKKFASLVPDEEDFHGSSDISKIATKSFCLASGGYDPKNNKSITYIKILKDREDSSRKGYIGKMYFSVSSQNYDSGYVLGREKGVEFESTSDESIPKWAVRAFKNPNRVYPSGFNPK